MRLVRSFAIVIGLICQASAQGADEGYTRSMFNGQNLDGWHVTNCDASVEQGSLVLKEGNGFVRSDHAYGDFTLELDWKPRQAAMYDSGIYFRSELPSGPRPWPTRYQVNLLEGDEGNCKQLPGATSKGLIKRGQWNHFKLTAVGSKASLEINGQPAWSVDGVVPATGYIGFQAEVIKGGQFEFKNIRLTEHGYRSLFNGRDLTGWEGATTDAAACWKVDEGLLVCTGEKGPWLRSLEEFGDFNLRLEYKLKPGGNSGVYVRVPQNGNHHTKDRPAGTPAGVEIQLLDDAAERYKTLKDYQYTGSVYAIAAAEKRVCKPAGQWNTIEINCLGPDYRMTHNGEVILTATASEFPELKNRLLKGYLGLQNHSEEVWFRNLRIGPAMQ
jgi:hypothetical protein